MEAGQAGVMFRHVAANFITSPQAGDSDLLLHLDERAPAFVHRGGHGIGGACDWVLRDALRPGRRVGGPKLARRAGGVHKLHVR